jgi:hypothetical protein
LFLFRRSLHRIIRNKSPGPMLRIQNPPQLHLPIRPRNRIRIDRQIHSNPPYRRQLVPCFQYFSGHSSLYLVNQLPINRHPGMLIQPKREFAPQQMFHVEQCTS